MIENECFVCISTCLLCGFCANSEKNKTLVNNERGDRGLFLDDCRRANNVSDSSLIHKSSFCSTTTVYIVFDPPPPTRSRFVSRLSFAVLYCDNSIRPVLTTTKVFRELRHWLIFFIIKMRFDINYYVSVVK